MYIAHTVPGRYPLLESNPVFGRRRINIKCQYTSSFKITRQPFIYLVPSTFNQYKLIQNIIEDSEVTFYRIVSML